MKDSQEALSHLKNSVPSEEKLRRIKEEENILDGLLVKEELWWAQRAKVQWLKHGDLNTKYFHYKASQRKRKNCIHSITDPYEKVWRDNNHIHEIFTTYFKEMFTSTRPIIPPDAMEVVSNRINHDMFSHLATEFTEKEVMAAIFQLKGASAPGPDGLTSLFYHNYWNIVGKDILLSTLNVLNNNGNPDMVNFTYISLIPKITHPSTTSDSDLLVFVMSS